MFRFSYLSFLLSTQLKLLQHLIRFHHNNGSEQQTNWDTFFLFRALKSCLQFNHQALLRGLITNLGAFRISSNL